MYDTRAWCHREGLKTVVVCRAALAGRLSQMRCQPFFGSPALTHYTTHASLRQPRWIVGAYSTRAVHALPGIFYLDRRRSFVVLNDSSGFRPLTVPQLVPCCGATVVSSGETAVG